MREVLDHALAHRLGERVDVGPTEGTRAHPAVLDQPLVEPSLAPLLRVDAHGRRACARVFLGGLGHEVLEHLGLSRLRLDLVTRLQRHLRLELVVDLVIERALGDHALLHAGDIGGRHVDEVRRVVRGRRSIEVPRAEQVGLESFVDRRVEADGGGRVDDVIHARGDLGLAPAEVALQHVDLLVEQGQERVVAAQAFAQDVEGRLARQVMDPVDGRRGLLAAHQDGHAGVREVEQEPLQDHLTQEAGHAGQEDALAGQRLDDRAASLYHAADYPLSTGW